MGNLRRSEVKTAKTQALVTSDPAALVQRVRSREGAAIEDIYALMLEIAGPHYRRRLSSGDVEDRLHEVFWIIVEAIETGALRKPGALAPFIRTVLRYQAAASVRGATRRRLDTRADESLKLYDGHPNPEEILLATERKVLLRRLIQLLARPDREILSRFYLDGQGREQICREMKLSATQFRLNKSRAKERSSRIAAKLL